jgi:hypothetical protein
MEMYVKAAELRRKFQINYSTPHGPTKHGSNPGFQPPTQLPSKNGHDLPTSLTGKFTHIVEISIKFCGGGFWLQDE